MISHLLDACQVTLDCEELVKRIPPRSQVIAVTPKDFINGLSIKIVRCATGDDDNISLYRSIHALIRKILFAFEPMAGWRAYEQPGIGIANVSSIAKLNITP
jgi:hypothetical protein